MKNYLFTLLLLAVPLTFVSCDDDDDDKNFDFVTEAVHQAFQNLYPQVQPYEWEIEGPYVKAEFYKDQVHSEAYFTPEGTWVRTETDFRGQLPEVVTTYLETNHPGYTIDDVDWVETPTSNYYEIELEKAGAPDVKVNITPEGALV
jgi:hypothetical protein